MTKKKSSKKSIQGKEKQSLGEKINRTLDIPPDVLPGSSLVSIRGRSSVSINGSNSIALYTPFHIKLSMKHGAISVRGSKLVCISYHQTEINIEGHIDSVSFEEDDDIG